MHVTTAIGKEVRMKSGKVNPENRKTIMVTAWPYFQSALFISLQTRYQKYFSSLLIARNGILLTQFLCTFEKLRVLYFAFQLNFK